MTVFPPELYSLILFFAFGNHILSQPCVDETMAGRARKPGHLLRVSSSFHALALPQFYYHISLRNSSDWTLLFSSRDGRLSKGKRGRRLAALVRDLRIDLAAPIPSVYKSMSGLTLVKIDLSGLKRVEHLCLAAPGPSGDDNRDNVVDASFDADVDQLAGMLLAEIVEEDEELSCEEDEDDIDDRVNERLNDCLDDEMLELTARRTAKICVVLEDLIKGGVRTISACLDDGPSLPLVHSPVVHAIQARVSTVQTGFSLHLYEAAGDGGWTSGFSLHHLGRLSSARIIFHDLVDAALRKEVKEMTETNWTWVDGPAWAREQRRQAAFAASIRSPSSDSSYDETGSETSAASSSA